MFRDEALPDACGARSFRGDAQSPAPGRKRFSRAEDTSRQSLTRGAIRDEPATEGGRAHGSSTAMFVAADLEAASARPSKMV